jgi:hypothetical protein
VHALTQCWVGKARPSPDPSLDSPLQGRKGHPRPSRPWPNRQQLLLSQQQQQQQQQEEEEEVPPPLGQTMTRTGAAQMTQGLQLQQRRQVQRATGMSGTELW